MNRRQLKKACKKAARRLESEFPGEFVCEPATGDETCYAPRGYQAPRGTPRWEAKHFCTPLPGTLVVWERTSYEYEEWDVRLALQVYRARCTDSSALAAALGAPAAKAAA